MDRRHKFCGSRIPGQPVCPRNGREKARTLPGRAQGEEARALPGGAQGEEAGALPGGKQGEEAGALPGGAQGEGSPLPTATSHQCKGRHCSLERS